MRRKSLIDLHSWKDLSHINQGHPRNCIAMLWEPPTSLALWLQVFTFVQCNSLVSFSKLNGSLQGSAQEAINWLFCKSFDWLCVHICIHMWYDSAALSTTPPWLDADDWQSGCLSPMGLPSWPAKPRTYSPPLAPTWNTAGQKRHRWPVLSPYPHLPLPNLSLFLSIGPLPSSIVSQQAWHSTPTSGVSFYLSFLRRKGFESSVLVHFLSACWHQFK